MPGLITDHSILPVWHVYQLITTEFALLMYFATHYDVFFFFFPSSSDFQPYLHMRIHRGDFKGITA